MKLNLDRSLGAAVTYSPDQRGQCPEIVDRLLSIHGVKSVFVCNDFITLNRDPRAPWKPILDAASRAFSGGDEQAAGVEQERRAAEREGQATVFVQTFRGVPVQVKVVDSHGESRLALPARFVETAQSILGETGADYLKERYWADWGVRYGAPAEIAAEVAAEIDGTLDDVALQRLKGQALGRAATEAGRSLAQVRDDLSSTDWCVRLRAVQDLGTAEEVVGDLAAALVDEHPQVRRLAAAALGASGAPSAAEPLSKALLSDENVGVRRTAGDALSDLGEISAQDAVCLALSDPNKLVRWRAARFLAEIGTEEALPSLEPAADDPEFEVRLEVRAAIERIKGGTEGSAPAWKRILDRE